MLFNDTEEVDGYRPRPEGCLSRLGQFYIRLVLGIMDQPGTWSNDQACIYSATFRRYMRQFTRFILPSYLCGVFFIDFSDWLMHNETSMNASSIADVREGRQNPIITKLAFLRSEFTTVVSVLPTILLLLRAKQFSDCMSKIDKLRAMLPVSDLQFSRRRILAELAVVYLLLASTFRLSYYLYSAASDTETFWEPTKYFVFTLSTGQVSLFIQISMIMAEWSALPVYHFLIRHCVIFCECSNYFNENLVHVSMQSKLPRKISAPATFIDLLNVLVVQDEILTETFEIFANCISGLLAVLLCGNCVVMASITANAFIDGNVVEGLHVAIFAAGISSPVVALGIVIGFGSLVHDTVSSRSRVCSVCELADACLVA